MITAIISISLLARTVIIAESGDILEIVDMKVWLVDAR